MITYGIPNDTIKSTAAITSIIGTPIIQSGPYTFLTRHRIRFGPIARLTVGFGILTLAMVYAAIV